ncbi:LADA_0E13410g1_1 [Lachancea dasiensis]|uniref:LADA_0E13410g1_1 n=1 Tax=Lachancea dasiensis TaxID=1072105 RepID=A0A1G4JFG3_9SACH|nr:LADA_0E13410g1_1 [Lachancea dasiensis]
MKVRKKQSKRTSTRMREGIKKKAAAQHRKERKQAKKDVTWKSNKKDPGIPASFPYKGKILEAIETRRQQELEDKEAKRQERLNAKRQAVENGEVSMDDDMDAEHDEGSNGLAALMESAQQAAAEYNNGVGQHAPEQQDEEPHDVVEYDIDFYANDDDDEDAEVSSSELDKSRKAYDKIFKTVVDASDVVLYVLDARDPEGTRSRKVEEAVLQSQGKRLILILNKIDLVPPFVLEQWMAFLKSSFPTIPLRAAPGATNASSFNKKLTQSGTASALLESLKTYANNSNFKRSIVVGVIGYPNVGKSSVINALTSRRGGFSKVCPVGNQAGVTTSLREVKIDNKLKILDSPGICFPSETGKKSRKEQEAELALLNALPPKYIVDPYPAILMMVKRLSKSEEMTEAFKKLYELPPIPASDADTFTKHFLIHVARKRGRIGKGGVPNLSSAGISVLNDWRDGKILGWVLPNSSKDTATKAASQVKGATSTQLKKTEQTAIVNEWSKEFDLDGLFASLDNAIAADDTDMN